MAGFSQGSSQVCKRIAHRLKLLNLSLDAYRDHLHSHPEEWQALHRLCRTTISRSCRDQGVFAFVERVVLPHLARRAAGQREPSLRVWSVGCGSGEEPYSVALTWAHVGPDYPRVEIDILGSDIDPAVLQRAARACYPPSSLRELPSESRL